MSSTSFSELAASASGSNEPECEPSRSARLTLGVEPCLPRSGRTFQSIATSATSLPIVLDQMALPLISSPADSPAKTPALPTSKAVEPQARERDSSRRPSAWLASYEPDFSWRTSQGCLIEGLETFSGPWPASGLMRNGNAFQRETLELTTSGSGYGSWPTPAARDGKDLSRTTAFLSARKRHSPSMATRLLESGVPWWAVSRHYETSMGFPLGWSAAVYTASETPFRHTSPKRSAGNHHRAESNHDGANARLIAAAPSLLAVLEEAAHTGLVESTIAILRANNDDKPTTLSRQLSCWLEDVRAAITGYCAAISSGMCGTK
jgi:hypothetical protein